MGRPNEARLLMLSKPSRALALGFLLQQQLGGARRIAHSVAQTNVSGTRRPGGEPPGARTAVLSEMFAPKPPRFVKLTAGRRSAVNLDPVFA